jgi:hypothetical protein
LLTAYQYEEPINFLRKIVNDFEPVSFASFVNALTENKHNFDLTEISQFYDDLKDGKSPKLIINKSLLFNYSYLVSSILPLYAIFDQDIDIITISCSDFLAKTANMIRHDLFHKFKLDRYFEISLLKKIYSTSVFESLTGRGCKLLILDNISLGNEFINDNNFNNNLTEWLRCYVQSRLYPNAEIIYLNSTNIKNDTTEIFVRNLKNLKYN